MKAEEGMSWALGIVSISEIFDVKKWRGRQFVERNII
jgi:hypothetical protein